MNVFRRFVLAMEFVAVGVLERELHKMVGLATWRLAHYDECVAAEIGVTTAERVDRARRRADTHGSSASLVQRSRTLLRESRDLLEGATGIQPVLG